MAEQSTPHASHTTGEKESLAPGAMPVIIILLIAAFVMILNETIVGPAVQIIAQDMHIQVAVAGWMVTAFMLTMGVVIPTTGFLLQRLSTRTIFCIALISFCLGTIVAMCATGFAMLIVGRVIQAAGTAFMMPLLMTAILTLVPLSRRGAMMGNLMIVISVAPALGPTVSGLINQYLGWRYMFIVILPIAVVAFLLGLKFLTNVGEPGHQKLDIFSVLLTVPAFGGLVYGISELGVESGGSKMPALVSIAIGVIALLIFVTRQIHLQKSDGALLDLRTFGYPAFRVNLLVMVVAAMSFFGTIILMPLYMINVLHLDLALVGLVLLPGGLMMGLAGPFVGRLFDKLGARPLVVAGAVGLSLGMILMANYTSGTSAWVVTVVFVLTSLSLSLIFTPAFTASLNPLPPQLYSHGSAILSTLQQVAGAIGTALLVSISTIVTAVTGNFLDGFHTACYVSALLGIVVLLLGFFAGSAPKPEGAAPDGLETASPAQD